MKINCDTKLMKRWRRKLLYSDIEFKYESRFMEDCLAIRARVLIASLRRGKDGFSKTTYLGLITFIPNEDLKFNKLDVVAVERVKMFETLCECMARKVGYRVIPKKILKAIEKGKK